MTHVPRGRDASASSALTLRSENSAAQHRNGQPMNPQPCADPVASTFAGLNEQHHGGGAERNTTLRVAL
jgi:hypothetical protein